MECGATRGHGKEHPEVGLEGGRVAKLLRTGNSTKG